MTNEKHLISTNEIITLHEEKSRYIKLANRYIGDYTESEELVSECMLKILLKKDSLYVSDIKSFFASVVKNRCLDSLKEKQKTSGRDVPEYAMTAADIKRLSLSEDENTVRMADCKKLLKNCKSKLPGLTFEIFSAKRLDKMSYKQISEAFGVSESRINFEIKRALMVFRKEFSDYGIFIVVCFIVSNQ